jgi:hypothetical protein
MPIFFKYIYIIQKRLNTIFYFLFLKKKNKKQKSCGWPKPPYEPLGRSIHPIWLEQGWPSYPHLAKVFYFIFLNVGLLGTSSPKNYIYIKKKLKKK